MWIPVKDSLALTLKVKRAKPETEPKMKIIKFFLERTVVMERDPLRSYLDQYEAMENDTIDEGRSFCGRGSDTHLAVREQQKARQAFLGVGITSFKHQSLQSVIF
jgi:hypothetical protein